MELDKVDKITSAHHEKFDLEDRLVKLDKALHDILQSVKHRKVEDEEVEIKSLRELVQKIGSHRVNERDTTSIIRENAGKIL